MDYTELQSTKASAANTV